MGYLYTTQIYIIQSDGSTLPAAINATSLALVDAGVGMKEMVAACSVALLDDQAVLVSQNC
jgi:exosome complex component RRP41